MNFAPATKKRQQRNFAIQARFSCVSSIDRAMAVCRASRGIPFRAARAQSPFEPSLRANSVACSVRPLSVRFMSVGAR
jgi:hypothetical protein